MWLYRDVQTRGLTWVLQGGWCCKINQLPGTLPWQLLAGKVEQPEVLRSSGLHLWSERQQTSSGPGPCWLGTDAAPVSAAAESFSLRAPPEP